MTDHRDPDTIPLSERIETAVSNHVLRACYIEMAKRLEALEEHVRDLGASVTNLIKTCEHLSISEFERARGGRPKKEAA
jgi:hypothetical protein